MMDVGVSDILTVAVMVGIGSGDAVAVGVNTSPVFSTITGKNNCVTSKNGAGVEVIALVAAALGIAVGVAVAVAIVTVTKSLICNTEVTPLVLVTNSITEYTPGTA